MSLLFLRSLLRGRVYFNTALLSTMDAEMDWISVARQFGDIPEINFGKDEKLYEEEISDGNLNYVVRIYTKTEDGSMAKSCVVKHAPPYIKCLGEAFPLGVERIHLEYKALTKFHSLSPGSVPQPYGFKPDLNTMCMEDLHGYEVLRKLLMRGEFTMEIAQNIGRHLGIIHNQTHVATIGADEIKTLDTQFENKNMISLTEQFIFTRPFVRGDETNKCCPEVKAIENTVYDDPEVIETVQKMLKTFLEKKECLLHGDLHTGSVLVKGQDARIIDLEFAYVGPAAFDLGLLVANYIFSYYRNMSTEENNDERRQVAHKMVDACSTTVSVYLEHQTACTGEREEYVSNLMSETAGFAGCEIVRRLLGAAHNADLEGMPLAEQECLSAGVRLLKASHRIDTISQLTMIALMLC